MSASLTDPATPAQPPSAAPFPTWPRAAQAVIDVGQRAFARGWLPATSGNLSVRAGHGQLAITRSGVDKGALSLSDILSQPLDQALVPHSSAEAELHLERYAADPRIGAVFHTHTLCASVLGRMHQHQGAIVLEGWELQKALHGVRSHTTRVVLPVFANTQDIAHLASQVHARFAQPPGDSVFAPGYVIAGHGLYAWGAHAQEAWRHLEALDVLLAQTLALRR